MQEDKPIVMIVDDDPSMRSSLQRLLLASGIDNITFQSAQEFLSASLPDCPCCLLLDIRMPGMDGMELQSELVKIGRDLPIVFITGHGDVPMSVQAMRAGAVNFLQKPFERRKLLDAIYESFEIDRNQRLARTRLKELQERASGLTPRELEIFAFVVSGALNKQIAYELGIQEGTVKVHRRQVMEKMKAKSLAELVKIAATLGVEARHVE
jgi:FixJ family two-component response regulator